MASYSELYDVRSNTELLNRIVVAIVIKAQILIDLATPTAKQIGWASSVLANPKGKADELFNYVLAKNNTLTVAQINAASDSAIQNQINAAVDAIIAGT